MIVSWDEWNLDGPGRTLSGPVGMVHLEPQVFDVLAYLVNHRERVVPKEELLDNIWGDQFVSESALTSRIKSARRAIGDDGRAQKYIRNVHGRGYQFVGVVDAGHHRDWKADGDPPDLALSIGLDNEFPFVGRSEEIRQVRDRLDSSGVSVVLIGGEPGIGKTRLAVELLTSAARSDVVVCAGRCEEHLGAPLQPIRDAVGQLAASHPTAFGTWAEGMEGQLVALIPGLVRLFEAVPQPVDGYSALEVLSTVLERANDDHPLAILIDDLHWSDEPTRAFISRRARRWSDKPIALVCTFRTTGGDLSSDVAAWISAESRRSQAIRLELPGIDHDSAHELVESVLGGERTAAYEKLVSQTEGHGLFLTESIRDVLVGGGSLSSVSQMVNARLNRLSAPVQDLVRAGAFLGSEFAFDVALRATDLEPGGALAAVDAAVDAGLLHVARSPERFRFSHQLVPQAIRASTSLLNAAGIHDRCAKALESIGASRIEIAHHTLGAVPLVPLAEAVERARETARFAVDTKQFDAAIRLLESVLSSSLQARDRAEVLLQLGQAGNGSGRAVQAAPRFEEAADLARQHGWTDVLVEAALGHYGSSPYRKPRSTVTLDLLTEADAALGDGPSLAKARVLAKTGAFSVMRLPLADCDEMTHRALDMVPTAEPRHRLELLELRSTVFMNPAGVHELEAIDEELERLRAEHDIFAADAAVPEPRILMLGRGDELRYLARSDQARIRAQPIAEWRDLTLRSTLSAFDDELEAARRYCDEAGSIGDQYWGDAAANLHAVGQVFVSVLGCDWDRPIELLERLLEDDPTQLLILHAAWAHLAGGNRGRGLELSAMVRLEQFEKHSTYPLGGNALIAAAEVALLLDDDEWAATAERHLAPFAELMLGLPWACSLAAADSLARLVLRRGDALAAAAHTATACRIYESLQAPALVARLDQPLR